MFENYFIFTLIKLAGYMLSWKQKHLFVLKFEIPDNIHFTLLTLFGINRENILYMFLHNYQS